MGISVYPAQPVPDYWLEMQKGNISGHSVIHKYGSNTSVPSGTWEGVQLLSESFIWLTTATTIRVKSGGDANDTAGGSGAQAITIEGLDETGATATESIELAGTSASSVTSTTFIRVFRAYIKDSRAGAYTGGNTAAITVENGTGGTDLILIGAGDGQTLHGAYTIPLGKTGYLLSAIVQSDGSKAADFRLCTRADLLDVSTPYSPLRIRFFWDGVAGQEILHPETPILKLSALTDIWIDARGGGAQTEVSIDMEILLVDD